MEKIKGALYKFDTPNYKDSMKPLIEKDVKEAMEI